MTPDMKAALEREGRRSDWRPIKTAPKDGTEILMANARVVGGCMVVAGWDDDLRLWSTLDGCGYMDGAHTHWTDLPEPPPPQGAETDE